MTNRILGTAIALSFVAGSGRAQQSVSYETIAQRGARAVVEKFARLRNLHDGPGVAETYTTDADYIGLSGLPVHGRAALAELWGSVTGQARRTIVSVEMVTPHVAVVRVLAEFTGYPSLSET